MALSATAALEVGVDCYATFSQIKAYVPFLTFNSDDTPTKAAAFQVIRGVYQETNSLLGMLGYKVPVASNNSTSIRVLSRFHALGAASQLDLMASSRGGGSIESARELNRQYQQTWKMFEAGQIKLLNASMADNFIHRRDERRVTYSFNPDSSNVEQSSTFTRSMSW